jgi:hypothetical protein
VLGAELTTASTPSAKAAPSTSRKARAGTPTAKATAASSLPP